MQRGTYVFRFFNTSAVRVTSFSLFWLSVRPLASREAPHGTFTPPGPARIDVFFVTPGELYQASESIFLASPKNDRIQNIPSYVSPESSRKVVFGASVFRTCPLLHRKTTIPVFEIIIFERPRNRPRIKKCLCACVHLHLSKSHFRSIRDHLESIRKSLLSYV